jgi:hypothetical protein
MSDLDDTLAQVRQRIDRYRGQTLGEQNTKSILIDPLLRALGWDVEDFEEVHREYKPKPTDNPVDYALFILRTPRLFVEAKALGGNLTDRQWANQIMGYAAVTGVEWVVLTNGDEYRIYNAHAPVPIEEKLFRSVKISDDGLRAADTLALLSKVRMRDNLIATLWKSSFVDQQIKRALEGLFGPDPDPAFVRLIRNRLPQLSPAEIKVSLIRLRITLDFPAVPVNALPIRGIPDGEPSLQGEDPLVDAPPSEPGTPWRDVTLQDIIGAGLVKLPLEIQKDYKGHHLVGRITAEGNATWGGREYSSLSTAAGIARASIIGTPPGRKFPQTNGWTFWQFVDADGSVKPLDILRQRYYSRGVTTDS